MNKTALLIFIQFTLISACVAVFLLAINFFGFAVVISEDTNGAESPKRVLGRLNVVQTDTGYALADSAAVPDCDWCILIDEAGNIAWSLNKPDDIPDHYTINDIARMTRWFLNDYPVYVKTTDYGLIVLGTPKNSVGKYDMIYSMNWFDTLIERIVVVLIINLVFAFIMAFMLGMNMYARLRRIMQGIDDLRQEKPVRIKEKGILGEIARSINNTSVAIERKNAVLARRDNARYDWISCISHDIRTPLSVIMGYSEELACDSCNGMARRERVRTIIEQSVKIKKLVEDLNLISSLEYDMQTSRKRVIRLCPLIRRVVSGIMNSKNVDIALELCDEKAEISADENLIERALFNLINNSIVHNKNGCRVEIREYTEGKRKIIEISDNGCGVRQEIIDNIKKIPKSAHGLGLPMAYRIITAHGGVFEAMNDNGFKVVIILY